MPCLNNSMLFAFARSIKDKIYRLAESVRCQKSRAFEHRRGVRQHVRKVRLWANLSLKRFLIPSIGYRNANPKWNQRADSFSQAGDQFINIFARPSVVL